MSSYQTFTVTRSVTFNAEHMERVEVCLDEFAQNTGALNILLTDTTGQVVTLRGRIDKQKAEALAGASGFTFDMGDAIGAPFNTAEWKALVDAVSGEDIATALAAAAAAQADALSD